MHHFESTSLPPNSFLFCPLKKELIENLFSEPKLLRENLGFTFAQRSSSNMGPETIPSFIFNGGIRSPPPLAWAELIPPWG